MSERGDIVDRANERAQELLDEGIYQAGKELRTRGTAECTECGDAIPQARRVALPSCTRCIDCQAAQERFTRIMRGLQ